MIRFRKRNKNTKIYLILLLVFLCMGVVYGALTTSFSMSGTVGVSSAKYTINYTGSNATFSSASNSIIYGSTTTNKITPSTGYYLKAFSCTNGYTASATTGVGANTEQTITINNNKKTTGSTCTATLSNSYTVTATTGTGVTLGASSLGITYGKTVTVSVTPSAGYYLSGASCTNGYTISNMKTGVGNSSPQTVTINNNNQKANSTCTFTGSNSYTVSMSGSNVTFGATSLAITYGSTKTVTLTPSAGYYLSGISCDNGYTVTATTGTSATANQTITIKNNSKTTNSTCTATMAKRSFTVTMSGGNATYSSNSFAVSYAGTNTVKITPSTGYYLSAIACTNGYTVTGQTTGTSATGAQTVTINNNSKVANSTCTVTMAARTFTTTMTGSNGTFSSNNIAIPYGGSKTVTITPTSGYYLKNIACTNGYTITASTGISATGGQTATIKNNGNANNSTCTATFAKVYNVNDSWGFSYTGSIQTFTVPRTGTYKLEVYGGEGGSVTDTISGASSSVGGKGGYATGNINLTIDTVLYVVVGGKGGNSSPDLVDTSTSGNYYDVIGGYNGGGNSSVTVGVAPERNVFTGAAGGGATHIASRTGLLSTLSSYKSNILIVAGGGGGGGFMYDRNGNGLIKNASGNGGAGGGTTGDNGLDVYYNGTYQGYGGSQTSGGKGKTDGSGNSGSFGQGARGTGAGGGGYYGGGGGSAHAGGGGGSGYTGGVTGGTMSNGQRSGNGYAKITLVSIS